MTFKTVRKRSQRASVETVFLLLLRFSVCHFVELPEPGKAFLTAEKGWL
jgi:hypothetical protein